MGCLSSKLHRRCGNKSARRCDNKSANCNANTDHIVRKSNKQQIENGTKQNDCIKGNHSQGADNKKEEEFPNDREINNNHTGDSSKNSTITENKSHVSGNPTESRCDTIKPIDIKINLAIYDDEYKEDIEELTTKRFIYRIIWFWYEKKKIDYNVANFLLKTSSISWMNTVNDFAKILDAKVHVNPKDARYAHIYEGIKTIVDRIVAELAEREPALVGAKLRLTGSTFSDLKVGK